MEKVRYDQYGNAIISTADAVESVLRGNRITEAFIDDAEEVALYNKYAKRFTQSKAILLEEITEDFPFEDYHAAMASEWFMPEQYKSIDPTAYILNKCETEEQQIRAQQELEIYTKRDLLDLLRFLIYLVDFMRENNIVWGVGRGSSVASYCLYLIGVHKIDSIKYNLDIHEFLR